MGYRIDDAEQVLQRGEDLPPGRHRRHPRRGRHHLSATTAYRASRPGTTLGRGLHWYGPDGDEACHCGPAGAMSDRRVTGFLVKVIDKAIENRDLR